MFRGQRVEFLDDGFVPSREARLGSSLFRRRSRSSRGPVQPYNSKSEGTREPVSASLANRQVCLKRGTLAQLQAPSRVEIQFVVRDVRGVCHVRPSSARSPIAWLATFTNQTASNKTAFT